MLFGKVLRNRYKILKKLGSGGFGDTFLAEDMDLPGNPRCVVKHLQTRNPNPEILQIAKRLFNQEAEVLYRLGKHHEQIPELLAHFEENGEFYLVQEFIDGHDLTTEIIPGKQLSETQVLKLLKEILEVLAVVHEHGVIHRDIKLQNIMRRQDGKIVLIDFGSVKEIKSLATNTEGEVNSTIVIGTPGYIPNEQANGKPRLSSDVYAVGMLGIQALTGVQPRKLPTDPADGEVVWRNLVSISNELADILTKMVRCNFKERYQTAAEALQALQAPSSPPSTIQQIPPPKAKTAYRSSSRASLTQGFPALGLFSLIGVGFGLAMLGKTFVPFNLQENQPTKTTNPAVENTNNQPQASPSVPKNKRSKNFFTAPPAISPSIFTPQRDFNKPATPAPSPSPTKNDTKSSQPVVKEETNLFPPPPTEREFPLPPPAIEEKIQPSTPPPPPPTETESRPSPSPTEGEIQPSTPPPPTKTESQPSTPPTTENDVPAPPPPTPATEEPNQQMMVVPTTPSTEEPTQQNTVVPTTPAIEESNQQMMVVPTTPTTEEAIQQNTFVPSIQVTEQPTQQNTFVPSTQVTEQPTQEMMVVPATPTAGG
ncbi:serine/threonine-protein kinase [Fischerella thermalis]|jgi:serine/threonine protein kinase|uniref:non-specific serine/threonine protein kinase n=4 Tax=Fischerella TaxID=1190 RepID=G6FXX6_9CYAN|nr:serine/threonine-protein kinase [Fischerella thermalis]PLZ94871.1 serine/threonine protein kinase [Fischerella thermalis CCMEE 5328]EHC10188.1 serine/threonine protein kinase [Fischerella thermalis JSC-11]PLZ25317.1 serine/threonine protein kinase [Fischerella thermalis WC341]PMB32910.1 serine/threonine protein kinase [Fischerella thermalis CCMEE 5208]PMB36048.1 serine/threonine protein kinase [Fischerella thermalis BR2B]